ncbi:hypothetical protein ASE60_27715 [Ensifer sp. Root278]|nr:hypothetical protein ASE60_27715 [Ensifer sp. Root278]
MAVSTGTLPPCLELAATPLSGFASLSTAVLVTLTPTAATQRKPAARIAILDRLAISASAILDMLRTSASRGTATLDPEDGIRTASVVRLRVQRIPSDLFGQLGRRRRIWERARVVPTLPKLGANLAASMAQHAEKQLKIVHV